MKGPSKHQVKRGYGAPLGCCKKEEGINFALYSRNATGVKLCLFHPGENNPFLELTLDPKLNKTGLIWHALICGLPEHFEYGYRVEGPYEPEKGLLFNPGFLVTDPYAKSLNTTNRWEDKSLQMDHFQPKSCFIDLPPFEWGDDPRPRIPMEDLIIYEMHVRAFTCDRSSKASHPGTFLGIIDKIPHFKTLGVNAIELLPIHEFDECDNLLKNPRTKKPLCNFWGYSTINFFSPMNRYASSADVGASIIEFKTMVKELHKNGIEVFLDVVYNHTAENEDIKKKYYSFKGIDNPSYYILGEQGEYLNFSGCGNTFNCNHPVGARLILDSLRYWINEMHIDGFRFDLASIMTRGRDGEPMQHPPLIQTITEDPIFADTKLIAEPWDAAGLYQVGSFPCKWAEWNGKYRDAIRCFIKGTDGHVKDFVTRICGSEDLYAADRNPSHSVNFVTAHDGYTLKDLVSYQEKHNADNGEENRDGYNDNASWNCGAEGPTGDKKILDLRQRQMRNFYLALMLSLGTPMVLMGDEYGHTRKGNNNAWCQDNELNWFLWNELEEAKEFFRYCSLVNHFRKNHAQLRRDHFLKSKDIQWHGHAPLKPDWGPQSRFVAYTLFDNKDHEHLYAAFNAHFEPAKITLPSPPEHKQWRLIINTALPSPHDFVEKPSEAPALKEYEMLPYSALVAKAL
jgi:isoamylase